jgi:hypothetical protein
MAAGKFRLTKSKSFGIFLLIDKVNGKVFGYAARAAARECAGKLCGFIGWPATAPERTELVAGRSGEYFIKISSERVGKSKELGFFFLHNVTKKNP